MTDTIHITSQLTQAIQDSRLLLGYAAQAGLQLDDQMLKTLVTAQYRLNQNAWTNEDEADFWQAFSKLNTMIKPVTIESLKAVSMVATKSFFRFRVLKFLNKSAYRTVFFYILLAMLQMVCLLTFQVYWLVGGKLSQNLATRTQQAQQIARLEGFPEGQYTEEYNALRMEIETTRATLLLWSSLWYRNPFFENQEEYRMLSQKDYDAEVSALQEELKDTVDRWRYFKDFGFDDAGIELANLYQAKVSTLTEQLIVKKAEYEKSKNEYIFAELEIRTRYVLQVLQRYLLPLLYGFLGATAYVLRSLINDIQQETYTSKSGVKYGVRTFLGALGGLIIGLFIVPKDATGLSTLPPMALSFLIGYNIEVLFSLMDRFITSMSQKKSASQAETAPATQSKE